MIELTQDQVDLLNRAGPRLPDALALLIDLLHPELPQVQGAAVRASGGRPDWTVVAVSAAVLVATVLTAVAIGGVPVPLLDVLGAVGRGVTGRSEGPIDTIIWRVRLPRALLAGAVGASLALAGTSFQAVFRNPLADPYLLGAASGAGFGAAVAMVYGPSFAPLAVLGVAPAAFVCALATVVAVVLLARRGGRLPTESLILAGVVIGSSLSAGTSFVMLAARERSAGVLSWLLGSFSFSSWGDLGRILPILVVALVLGLIARRPFDLLQLGEGSARQLGLPVDAFKWVVITAATLLTAAAVAACGVIGFIGLITPHAVRLALGPEHRSLVPLAALWGATFLILADLLARTVIAPAELPVGVITALAGGPFFLVLLRRGRRGP